jgi:hypothetical protein
MLDLFVFVGLFFVCLFCFELFVVVKATKGKTVWVVAQLKKIFLNQNDV